jgi:hypothetical protein
MNGRTENHQTFRPFRYFRLFRLLSDSQDLHIRLKFARVYDGRDFMELSVVHT